MQQISSRAVIIGTAFSVLLVCSARSQKSPEHFISFAEFKAGLEAAGSSQYLGRSDSRIADAGAFNEMRRYVLDTYNSVQVAHSFLLDSQYFDCIPIEQQPSVRQRAPRSIASPPPDPPAANILRNRSSSPEANAPQIAPTQSRDQFGNVIGCQSGSIPF